MPKQYLLDKCYIEVAETISQLSNCVSFKVGAVIVQDGRVISTGYNGSPKGHINCNDVFNPNDFDREKHHKWSKNREIHAEMNSIITAAKHGININNATLYCTLQPCSECIKNICQSGIKRIVFKDYYDKVKYDSETMNMIKDSNINIEQFTNQQN